MNYKVLVESELTDVSIGSEESDFEYIRTRYMADFILQYHNALYFSAHAVSSRYLVECMELAKQVGDNQEVTGIFIKTGRMRELVDALALSSKALVNTQAKNKKSFESGERMGIWDVQLDDDGEEEEEMTSGIGDGGK